MVETMSMISIMFVQVLIVLFGIQALYRMVRGNPHKLDSIMSAVALVAATQINITFARIRYGASINNFHDVPDWTASNFLGALCIGYLLLTIVKTARRL